MDDNDVEELREREREQEVLISRLMARIAELEEKVYLHEFNEEQPRREPAAPLPPPKPEPPKLGFLSAIRESLRQLEESTGYATPARPQAPPLNPGATAPTTTTCGSQLPSPLPQHLAPQHTGSSTATATTTATTTTTPGGTRIVYYVEPPPEVSYQMHHLAHHHPQQAGVEDSQPSSSSTATTPVAGAGSGASADWMTRLGWGGPHAKPPPRDGLSLPDTPDGAAAERASLYPDTGGGLSVSGGGGQAHRLGEPATSVFREGLRLSASGLPGTAAAPPAQAPQAPAPHQPAGPGPAAAAAASAGTPAKPAGAVSGGGAGDWFSSLFKGVSRATTALQYPGGEAASGGAAAAAPQSAAAYNERTFDIHAGLLQPAAAADQQQQANGSYYRYVFDPADVAAEMEVTSRVRKAAAEALMQAEEKLRVAEQAQAAMQKQLEQAKELSKEIEALRRENEAALATRAALEGETAQSRSQLESMRAAQESLKEELDGMRTQASIWKNATSDEQDKLKQENQLIRNQITTRLNELQVVKSKLAESDAERQRQAKEIEELSSKLQWLTKINKQLENSAQQLEGFRKLAAEAQDKFMKERAVRRRLHEQLQQLRGNIRVMCRVRPALPAQASIISYPLEGLLAITPQDRRAQEFEFDHVFGPGTTQEAVYDEVSPLVRSCADGYNVCIFAYGQTGSGKTFTMEGPEDAPGINVRALQELFSIGAEEGIDLHWKVQVSMLEVYNDAVHDLLAPAAEVASRSLDVSALGAGELPAHAERVPGATWKVVASLDDVKQVLREGSKNRATASTALNASSSRSHAVLSVRVTAHSGDMALRSSLHLVDLAGSERVDKSEVTGQQLKEAQSINKSLSALGDVISALQRRSSHIPFRNSKLTQILQDSLCGTSKVLLVCNISPEPASASETLSSLNFANRAAQVELGQARKNATTAITAADRIPPPHPAAAATAAAANSHPSGGGAPPAGSAHGGGATSDAASGVRGGQAHAHARESGTPPPLVSRTSAGKEAAAGAAMRTVRSATNVSKVAGNAGNQSARESNSGGPPSASKADHR